MQSELKDADVTDAKWDNYGWYLGAKSMLGVFFFLLQLGPIMLGTTFHSLPAHLFTQVTQDWVLKSLPFTMPTVGVGQTDVVQMDTSACCATDPS